MRGVPLWLAIVLLALAGCASKSGPTRSPEYERCLADLETGHARYEPIADFTEGKSCGIHEGVKLRAVGAELNSPLAMTCALADHMLRFEREAVQPSAQRIFGQPVVKIHHYGSYSCRSMTGRSDRMSLHASGKAVDIGIFELADGTKISVLRDWRAGGAKQRFLREVAQKSCGIFTLVLTPNANHAHRDHFHLDLGPYRLCAV